MLQIVMWITILSLYYYALFIESNHDLYWFGFGIGKHAVKPISIHIKLLRSAKHLF